MFALSLWSPPTVIERLARLGRGVAELPPDAVRYTRHVTEVWCGFFTLNAAIAIWSALAASREVWALYNGFLAYVGMCVLFFGERVVRRVNFDRGRVRPSFSMDASVGADVWKHENRSVRVQADALNLTNRLNVINFAGLFSGTAVAPPRTFAIRASFEF